MPSSHPYLALGLAALILPGALAADDQREGKRPPNIVLIVADDLGYGELSIQGNPQIPTPHIDSIARNGVRFTDGYVTGPVCSPTRAGLLSGRYQQRFGHELNPGPPAVASDVFGLPKDLPLLPERLKAKGYATGMFGKWHLGYGLESHPARRGFDRFYGFLAGAHSYVPGPRARRAPILRGEQPVEPPAYLTDAFGSEAAAFVREKRESPYFLYLPFNAVHSPLQAPERYQERARTLAAMPKRQTFAAMLLAMDDAVGEVLKAIRETGREEETLIIFHSDNGGPTRQTTSRNDPLSGFKGQLREGGVRVPFMLQWKSRVPAGQVYRKPVNSLDVTATCLTAAGAAPKKEWKQEGVDLIPFLTAKPRKEAPHEALFWRSGSQCAIRKGDWKLIWSDGSGEPELYDLSQDPGESADLSAKQPEKVKELRAAWDAWNKANIPPRWRRGTEEPDEMTR